MLRYSEGAKEQQQIGKNYPVPGSLRESLGVHSIQTPEYRYSKPA
jgi:hypothetical protein